MKWTLFDMSPSGGRHALSQAEYVGMLEEAAAGACVFDRRPKEWEVESLLLGKYTGKRQDFETTDSRPLCEVMRDKWLAHADFDVLRDMEAFKKIWEQLSGYPEEK